VQQGVLTCFTLFESMIWCKMHAALHFFIAICILRSAICILCYYSFAVGTHLLICSPCFQTDYIFNGKSFIMLTKIGLSASNDFHLQMKNKCNVGTYHVDFFLLNKVGFRC
jgi:hypothetical protein